MLTANLVQIQPLCDFIVIDLETGDAPPEAIEAALSGWKPPANVRDPEKIEARRLEAAAKCADRAALLDASPVLCVAIQSDHARVVFNGMDASAPVIDGWPVVACSDERGLLLALRAWLDTHTNETTTTVGHNLRAFDLPKLRGAYVRHGLRLPALLRPRLKDEERAETMDTASLFKAFSMEHRDDFCPSLETVAVSFGIPRPKQHMSGADCPRLFREGQIQTVLIYCCVDVATTARAYQLMTGAAPDLD